MAFPTQAELLEFTTELDTILGRYSHITQENSQLIIIAYVQIIFGPQNCSDGWQQFVVEVIPVGDAFVGVVQARRADFDGTGCPPNWEELIRGGERSGRLEALESLWMKLREGRA